MATKKTATKKEETTDLGVMTMGAVAHDLLARELTTSTIAWTPAPQKTYGFWQRRGKPIPNLGTEWAAGMDIAADLEVGDVIQYYNASNQLREKTARGTDGEKARLYIEAGERVLIPTGLHADIPEDLYLAIHARSGTSWKKGLILTNGVGVVDADYVEEIKVSLTNVSGSRVVIEDGERIAQLLLMPVTKLIDGWKVLNEKPAQKTSRAGGFGSTGL